MDLTEDLSARVLLKNILSTDPPRTPFTRSASKAQSTSATRRNSRLDNKDAGAQTPKDILRRSLRHKIRESITRKSLPATKRRTASVVLRKTNTPAPASLLFDDADTPRHILKNIMQTDPVRSPVVHEKAASEEPQLSSANSSISSKRLSIELSRLDLPDITIGNATSTTRGLSRKRPRRSFNVTAFEKYLEDPVRSPAVHEKTASEESSSANSSITSKRPSIELSGLDLPDITIGNAASTTKGLSRKRPRRSLNVTTFEKGLKDVEEENEESIGNHSSLSLSSSTSLSLKTPFVDVRTEKRGLQRKVGNRRKITEEDFGAAVDKRQMEGVGSFVEQGLSDTTFSEGFTLGLSKLSEPDITTDIVHCNTALYAQPDAMISNFSIVATQDKPTAMASQLQQPVIEMEQEEQMEMERSKQGKDRSMYLFPTEEGVVTEPQNEECFSQTEDDVDAAESQKEEGKRTADSRSEDAATMSISEEEEGRAKSQTSVRDDRAESEDEENRVEVQTKEEVATEFLNEEEDSAVNSQTEEEEEGVDSQHEEDVAASSQSEEEEVAPDSQTEEEGGAADSQIEELGAVDSKAEEEEDIVGYQSDQEDPAESGLAGSQTEEEHDGELEEEEQASEQLDRGLEHISRRAHCSGGGVMALTEAGGRLADGTESGWPDSKSKAHSAMDARSSLEMGSHESSQPHTGINDMAESSTHGQTDASHTEAEPDADKENSFHLSIGDSGNLAYNSPEEAAAQDSAEQEEEWEDEDDGEESEEVPSKTPAFVREKRKMFQSDPLASPSVLKNVQASSTSEGLPASKPKQVRKRKGPAKREGGLPKSYLMSVFKHFAKTKVSADVYPVLKETMDKFFERLADDLETYAVHAKRKTIEVEDAELLLKRQGYVNEKVPVEVLIEKYLRMDQRKLLIPIATSGNVVIPKRRR